MRVLDLFSGIGGFSLGLERAGMRTVAFCEIDPYCRAVLARHWPGVPIFEDICELTVHEGRLVADPHIGHQPTDGEVPARREGAGEFDIDLICGGFPCQDISVAGKGAGLAGARSGLWREYHRLIRELRPRYVIVENVSALLSRGLGTVLGDLAQIGYDAEWHCIPASYVGAPHRRDRVWIVAYPQGTGSEARGGDGVGVEHRPRRYEGQPSGASGKADVAYPDSQRGRLRAADRQDAEDAGESSRHQDSWGWEFEPDVRGMADGIPAGLDGEVNAGQRMDTVARSLGLPENRLRSVWRDIAVRAASQGSRPDEQLARELADRVPNLPHALALAGGQSSMEAATRFLHRLRQAIEALGAMPDASQPTAQAWLALPCEAAERAYLAACGRADWGAGEWPGVGRVALKVPARVDRLKALGNAVVPQVVEMIGHAIMAGEVQ